MITEFGVNQQHRSYMLAYVGSDSDRLLLPLPYVDPGASIHLVAECQLSCPR